MYLGKVTYIDYSRDVIPESNVFSPVMRKRKSFEYESELRALILETPLGVGGDPIDFHASPWEVGAEVKVDLQALIDKVHVSPTAPAWFAGLVVSLTARYGFGWEVTQSVLLEDPLF